MPQATIFVELDTSSVTTGSKILTDQFGNALRTVQNQANTSLPVVTRHSGDLNKVLDRLSSSRAPQFMGALTSSVVSSIPALQGSAAAMTLMSTAAFGLQNVLMKLVGAGGVILLGITALSIFASKSKEMKDTIEPLNESLQILGQRYLKMQELGIVASATQTAIKNKITDLNKELENLNKTIALAPIELEKFGLAGLTAAEQEKLFGGVVQKNTEGIERIKAEIAEWQKLLNEFSTKKTIEELDKFTKALPSLAVLELKETGGPEIATAKIVASFQQQQIKDTTRLRLQGIKEWEKTEIQTAINIAKKQKDIEAEKREAQIQTARNFAETLADMFSDVNKLGKSSWDDLIKWMEIRLAQSIIVKIFSELFSRKKGGIFGDILGFLGFQSGINYVPATGFYQLHKGEAVIPASQNPFTSNTTNNWGGNTYIIQISQSLEPDTIRNKLIPELKKMAQGREFNF